MTTHGTIQTKRVVCPLDCPDGCELDVRVEAGMLLGIEAKSTTRNPITAAPGTAPFICAKVRRFERHLKSPERLTEPLVRVGKKGDGAFEPRSWDFVLELLTKRLLKIGREHGPESILPVCYGGSNGLLSQDAADALFFRRLGAARILRTLCAMPSGRAAEALYGKMPGVVFNDYAHANLICIWGCNPSASGIHLVPHVQAALKRGATLLVVDPRRTSVAKQASLHLAPRPGTDLPLALALIRWIFKEGRAHSAFLEQHASGVEILQRAAEPWTLERAALECRLEPDQILRFAELYSQKRPAVLRCGWGQERNRNGGFATAAILALPAVAGHFGVRGGGYTMSQSGAWRGDLGEPIDVPDRERRTVNLNRVGRELCEPRGAPIRALFVYNCNPLVTLPNQNLVRQGLLREDLFTIVFDAVATDTSLYADVVLPATTFLEHRDWPKSYGALTLSDSKPALEPAGQARNNHQVFRELAKRMGLVRSEAELDPQHMLERVLAPRGQLAADLAELEQHGNLFPSSGPAPIQFGDTFPRTPDQKVHLAPPELALEAGTALYHYRPEPELQPYPLALISPATARTISSTFGQLLQGIEPLHMHPTDAQARGLQAGEVVRVFNGLGEVRTVLALDDDLTPGLCVLVKGLWERSTLNGNTSNALCPDTLSDLGGGACFNDARVEVERVL